MSAASLLGFHRQRGGRRQLCKAVGGKVENAARLYTPGLFLFQYRCLHRKLTPLQPPAADTCYVQPCKTCVSDSMSCVPAHLRRNARGAARAYAQPGFVCEDVQEDTD